MIRQSQIVLSALLLLASLSVALGQTSPQPAKAAQPANSPEDKSKAKANDEAKRLDEQKRATAVSLLISVADEAKSYSNQTLRARIQARAADILWESDVEKARALFRRAWDAADVADAENQRRVEEERRAQEQAGKRFAGAFPPSLRTEVLRIVARRDRKLGEEFLAKLDDARKQAAANTSTQRLTSRTGPDPYELSPALKLRLRLAQQLLDTDVERAIEFADPGLTRVSVEGLVFLCYLRQKNAAAADERYAAMLAFAGAEPSSDANAVSLMSSYIFTPFLFVMFTPDGSMNSSQFNVGSPAPDVSSELRSAFFRFAEQIFLRPLPPPEQDTTTTGRIGKYRAMSRMLPYFERYASEQSTTLMKAQLTALSREVPEDYRERDSTATSTTGGRSEEDGDTIDSLLDRIERADTQEERDTLYAQLAILASEKGDPRAPDFADKIDDSELRKSVRAYIDFNGVRTAIEKKRTEDALKLARSGALTNIQRVWALTQIARDFIKTDRERSIELLDEAAVEARRIGGSSADRARALIGVATVLYEANHAPAWEIVAEASRAANNATEEFSGEDATIVSNIRTKNQTSMMSFTADGFDLPGIFRLLAKEDLQRAIVFAKEFNGESPRATGLIAIVRAILDTKPAAVPKKQQVRVER